MLGIHYTLPEIAQMIEALDLFQGAEAQYPLQMLAFDTRNIMQGEETLFIALKTQYRDGHDFIEKAIEKGVKNFLVDRHLNFTGVNYILVENTLDSLQIWAMRHRQRFTYPVIGITGSNGKTIVKEWLTTLLEPNYQIVKSPMSYNSQLGVAISLLQMSEQSQLAIIEAGISKPQEMEILAEMIQPTIGIFTHIGNAHSENFTSLKEKINEKWKLFSTCDAIFCTDNKQLASPVLQANQSFSTFADLPENLTTFFKKCPNLPTKADKENAALASLVALHLGLDRDLLCERLPLLYPILMRVEMITDNPRITIINDSYNSDRDSVMNAFQVLKFTHSHATKKVILSDMQHQGKAQVKLQKEVLAIAEKLLGKENVYTIGEVFCTLRTENTYPSTQNFIQQFDNKAFQDCVLLIKGARNFELERLIPLFNPKLNASIFKINLNYLSQNLRYFKSLLPQHTKMMCMVKAFSYGSGTWEVAEVLQKESVDYLAVAYTSEAVELREKGIKLPIMVMNPEASNMLSLAKYNIQPEIYEFDLLEKYLRAARLAGLTTYPIHLKFDTGMGRLGFSEEDLPHLFQYLTQYPDIQVVSLMTHLAAADDESADAFTLQQLERFEKIWRTFAQTLGITPLRHALNSAGILRFPQYAWDMVRLGVGLYGINPTNLPEPSQRLKEIGTLQTLISQIHSYPENTSVGYGRSQFTHRESRIATVPIGYADGILRCLGNGKTQFWLHGKPAPTFGRVCMDMLMLDVTDIPEAKIGDTVLIFGENNSDQQSVNAIAAAANTISYEILTRISPRVRRVYEWE
ncbi:MAG: alanine racemase [Bacteroidia bacterium]